MHYVWTRIALAADSVDLNASRRGHMSDEAMADNITLWLHSASKFYECQTVNSPFHVLLQASECYRPLVESYQWPEYATLVYDEDNALTWAAHNLEPGEQCTFSRLDADDSFSVDIFEFLDEFVGMERLIIYHKHRQYNLVTGELTKMLWHYAPMFATRSIVHWQPIADPSKLVHEDCQFTGVVGTHGKYPDHPLAVAAKGCFAMQRLTGNNVASAFGVIGNQPMDTIPLCDRRDPRFVGYEEDRTLPPPFKSAEEMESAYRRLGTELGR